MANETVVCTYRVKSGDEDQFRSLLARHWQTLQQLGFVTGRPAMVYRSLDEPPTYIEIFTWRDGGFADAHEHPDVLAIWESIDPLLEDRDGLPKWDFPHFSEVTLSA